jgi:hypothetical protein
MSYNTVGIATTGWTNEGSEFESRYGQEFSLPHVVQTGSKAYSISTKWVPGTLFVGAKRPGREEDYSLPTSAKVKKC